MNTPYTACVPCYNNAATLRRAVESLLAQTVPPAEVIVVDDGSTDSSAATVADLPVRAVRLAHNSGRGAARSRGMAEARHDWVLWCDAGVELEGSFMEKARRWCDDSRVAAVRGKITQPAARTAAGRWRGRHLFKLEHEHALEHGSILCTGGALLRRSAVLACGSFDPALRHNEDGDLGDRLRSAGHDVIYDPSLLFCDRTENTVLHTLERYWRWYAGRDETVSWRGYARAVSYSIKVMCAADLRAGEPLCAAISLACPHYQFWKSWWRGQRGR